MNQKHKELCAKLLEMAAEEFSNHGCNDLGSHLFDGWTTEEKQHLYENFHKWNGDPESSKEGNIFCLGDSELMNYFADQIRI